MSNKINKCKKNNIAFDVLRGVAALLVFVFHFWQLSSSGGNLFFFTSGHIGLDIFFVLSAYLIFSSLYKHGVNKEYFFRRMLRIMPLYYFSILIVFVLGFFINSLSFDLKDFLYHLSFIQSFNIDTYYSINPVLWSLSVEMILYLFLPILILITGNDFRKILISIVLMLIVAYVYRYWVSTFYYDWDTTQRIVYTENFIGCLDRFAFGILAALFVKISQKNNKNLNFENNKNESNFIRNSLFILGLVLIIFAMILFDVYKGTFRDVLVLQVFLHSIVSLGTAILLYVFAIFKSNSNIFYVVKAGVKSLSLLGVISYSFYVWHYLIIQFLVKTLSGYPKSVLFLAALFLASFFSFITYRLVELPFLRRKKY